LPKSGIPIVNSDNVIDLTQTTQTTPTFECEFCSVALMPYPQLKLSNPYAGDGYICPRCGIVTDSSYKGMRAQVRVEPVDVGMDSDILDVIPEDKGKAWHHEIYDPEPNEEEQIKAMGGKIIDKTVVVHRDY
jgi:hypothetical protein